VSDRTKKWAHGAEAYSMTSWKPNVSDFQVRFAPSSIGRRRHVGFTLLELMLALAVASILLVIGIPGYQRYMLTSQIAAATADIGQIELLVAHYESQNNEVPPPDLSTIGMDAKLDPWGQPYYYHTTVAGTGNGVGRKDKSLHPINTDYDLYSSGPDTKSVAALTAKPSQDDIIRANDGSFLGVAANY